MAKLSIMGDSIQIKSTLTKKEVLRVQKFAPEALKVFDEDGNEVFGIGLGSASCSQYGICFSSVDSEDKIFMTMENPIRDHSDTEWEKKQIVEFFAQTLYKLELVEANIADAKAELERIENDVEGSVTFVD